MRILDVYWQTNDHWWEFRNHIPVVRDDAPEEAKISYAHYLEQIAQSHYTAELND